MGPGEAIAALALFVGMPWIVLSGIAKIKAAGSATLPSGRESSAMRKSELQAMIDVAVEDATEPLRRRVESLEAIVTDEDAAQGRIDAAVLHDLLDEEPEARSPAGVRRRDRG